MKKAKRGKADRDTLREEYDFSGAVRGATAERYREGTNIVVIEPELLDVFPDARAVNEALRALAPVIRRRSQFVARRGKADTSRRATGAVRRPRRPRRPQRPRPAGVDAGAEFVLSMLCC